MRARMRVRDSIQFFLNIVSQQFDFLQTTLLKEIIFTIKQNIPLIHKSFANVEEGLFL